jgi:DNA modification methylase
MTYTLHLGDCLDVLKTLPDASVDAVVTDPPYELGFMGKKWDAAGIAYSVPLWTEALRVLKPGGHLLAFGGTRTYHRMACAIEDAGFEVRDSLHWIYGSGFPKSLNLDGAWHGWGTALKPAHEPVVVARKSLVGTVAANVLAHGTGALNIDGCRVGTTAESWPATRREYRVSGIQPGGGKDGATQSTGHAPAGRWPPNILLSHTPECGEACAEDCAVAEMDRQSGTLKSGTHSPHHQRHTNGGNGQTLGTMAGVTGQSYPDSGGASRFFPVFRYQAKASRSERERGLNEGQKASHPTVKPVELMRWLVRLVTPRGGVVLDPFTGSGTTGVAAMLEGAQFVGIEREPEYHAIATARINHATRQETQLGLSA